MPIYKCYNPKCSMYKIERYVTKTKISIIKGKVIDIKQKCPICGVECIGVKTDGFTTTMHGGVNVCRK